MSKTILVLFWIIWLLDVAIALYGYWEFIGGVFGRYANPSSTYIALWLTLFAAAFLILGGSLFLKNHGQPWLAMGVAAIPLVLALPFVLWIIIMTTGKVDFK